MRWSTLLLAVTFAATLVGPGGARPDMPGPGVAIFYYSWDGTPARDGEWQHWGQRGAAPPATVASAFYPARGPYSSTDPAVLRTQMREIAGAGVDTVIVSWWGPGSPESARLAATSGAARRAGLRVAIHLEPWAGRTPAAVADAIRALARQGVRDFYVYDSMLASDDAWAEALAPLEDVRVFANTWLVGRAARGGFDGLYSYDVLVHDGRSFRRVCAAARRAQLLCAPSVGPGFDGRRATPVQEVAARRDGRRYDAMWRAAIDATPDIVTITSYNEWHEGTQIEPARAGVKGCHSYERAYGQTGKAAETAYLTRTASWAARARAARSTPGSG
jgi:hypothetical protein